MSKNVVGKFAAGPCDDEGLLLDQISRPFGQTVVIQAVPALEFSVPRKAASTSVSTVNSNCDL